MPDPEEDTGEKKPGRIHSGGHVFYSMEEMFAFHEAERAKWPWYKKLAREVGIKRRRFVNHWIKPSPYRKAVWFVQRGRRGWAECDTWSVDSYVARVLSEMLPVLAAREFAWPGDGVGSKWQTPEEWTDHLNDLADRIGAWASTRDSGFAWDKFEVSLEAMKEFADNFGRYWD